jgi:hypothetical protein
LSAQVVKAILTPYQEGPIQEYQMALRKKNVGIAMVILLLAASVMLVPACASSSDGTTSSTDQAAVSSTSSSISTTSSTFAHKGAAETFVDIGQTVEVEQGELTVWKVTVTDNLASDEANALLLTGDPGEQKNVSKLPAEGDEFLLITFKYKKTPSYGFRGGLYSDDIILQTADGKAIPMVDAHGYGGISESNAGKVQPDVEAYTTAVYEVPKGETGLTLIYHKQGIDGFTCKIR